MSRAFPKFLGYQYLFVESPDEISRGTFGADFGWNPLIDKGFLGVECAYLAGWHGVDSRGRAIADITG